MSPGAGSSPLGCHRRRGWGRQPGGGSEPGGGTGMGITVSQRHGRASHKRRRGRHGISGAGAGASGMGAAGAAGNEGAKPGGARPGAERSGHWVLCSSSPPGDGKGGTAGRGPTGAPARPQPTATTNSSPKTAIARMSQPPTSIRRIQQDSVSRNANGTSGCDTPAVRKRCGTSDTSKASRTIHVQRGERWERESGRTNEE